MKKGIFIQTKERIGSMAIEFRKIIQERPPNKGDELRVKGVSLVLFDAFAVNKPIPIGELKRLCENDKDFKEVISESEYTNKIFSLGEEQKLDHKVMVYRHPVPLPPIEISKEDVISGDLSFYIQTSTKHA